MSVKLLGGRTYPGRSFTGTAVCAHGTPAVLQDMTKGTTLALIYMETLPTGDQYIWGRVEAGSVFNVFRFTPTTLRRRMQTSATALDIQATFANLPSFGLNKWIVVGATWNLTGATAEQALYCGDLNNPLREAVAYSARNVGSGTITSDATPQFRLFSRGGANEPLGGIGHTVYIRRDYVAGLPEMREIAQAMMNQVSLANWQPTGAWVVGKTDGGSVWDESVNGTTGTLNGSTASIAPPLRLRPRSAYRNIGGSPPAFTARGLWFTR